METDVLVHGSKNQHGSLIIKLFFCLIMISPQRISNVESLDNQSLVLCLSAYRLITSLTTWTCFFPAYCCKTA